MQFDGIETRKHPRYAFAANIEFCLDSSQPAEVRQGVSFDISAGGIGLYIFSILKEGDEVTIKSDLPVPHNKAKVCWVKPYSEEFCRAGLMFVS